MTARVKVRDDSGLSRMVVEGVEKVETTGIN